MGTINLDLIMQKGSRVVHMIIAHKLHIKMRAKKEVALAVELSIYPLTLR